jgi:uncharacterized protein (UPF0332 family)
MLRHKARDNLRAGEALAALGLVDPATSRYYYAMYQAAVHALTRKGWTPGRLQSGAVDWSHVVVMNNAYLLRGRADDRRLFATMRDLRMQADYGDGSVVPFRLADEVDRVRDLVEELVR